MSYRATVERDGRVWLIRVEGVGVTQARHLRELDDMVTDLIEVMTDDLVDPDEIDYDIMLPAAAQEHLTRSMELRQQELAARSDAAGELRAAVRVLVDQDLPMRDIGQLLGVSHQRVHQLVKN